MRKFVPVAASLSLICGLILLAGCGEGEQIRTYPVPTASTGDKTDPPVPVAGQGAAGQSGMPAQSTNGPTYPARMLVAMVEQGPQTWFFKLLGPVDNVASHEDEFHDFVKSLKFADNKPQWSTPTGWKPQGKSGLRMETFHVGEHDPNLELTVIPLGTMSGGGDKSILENLNRWRGQLKLAPLGMDQLQENIQRVKLSKGAEAIVMNIVGNAPTNNPGGPPMASGSGLGRPKAPRTAASGNDDAPITFDTPEGWTPGETNAFRKVAFDISDGDQKAVVTVIPLPESGTLANVNRWRGQVGLGETTADELKKELAYITVDGIESPFAEAVGKEQTILAAIVNRDGKSWFFKLQGDVELAAQEKDHFRSFVTSVKFK